LYENRISHVDPVDNWHRESGRIYRVRAKDAKPLEPFDLAKKTGPELVELLRSKNKWMRETALRLLYDRKDDSLVPTLLDMLNHSRGQDALEAFWGLNACGGLNENRITDALRHENPDIRRWAVRLAADQNDVSRDVAYFIQKLAKYD